MSAAVLRTPAAEQAGRQSFIPSATSIAKIHTIVPRSFNLVDAVSPKWRRYSRAEIRDLKQVGLVSCIDEERHLWKWNFAHLRTPDSNDEQGGLLLTSIRGSLRGVMQSQMARGLA
jgi:hypothetical protein